MNRVEMQKGALAARDAHLALLDLKRLVDEAAKTAHAAELDAVGMAISTREGRDIRSRLSTVMERLQSPNFEATLSHVREKLETAISTITAN